MHGLHTWFLEIICFVHASMCVSVCPSVCLPPRALITSGMIWCDIGYVWLVKPVPQVFSLLPSINWMGVALVTQCVVHARQRCWSWCHIIHKRRHINYLVITTRWSTLFIKMNGWMHSNSFKRTLGFSLASQ